MAVAPIRELPAPAPRRRRLGLDLREMPWWTAADQAELDVLVRALILGVPWHSDRCPLVAEARSQGLPAWCHHLTAAVEEVLEWRDARETYSRARYLRSKLG